MEIILDLSQLSLIAENPLTFVKWILLNGWVFFVAGFILFFSPYLWLSYVRSKYDAKRNYTLLAIDVPRDNEQTPKAVESIFAQLSGIPSSPSFIQKWFYGVMPESFSCEIVSMGGYIQFLIHTPSQFRDLVEAAVYSQYPDAEIVEVEDYAQKTRGLIFPHEQYDLWGTELVLTKKEFYPIKTYPMFEHSLSQQFKDPLASILETLGNLSPDEQIWIQLVITPASDSWKEGGEAFVKKLIGEEVKTKKSLLDTLTDAPLKIIDAISDIPIQILHTMNVGSPATKKESESKKEVNKIPYLTPGERSVVERIESKISKIGFYTKFRIIYIARKEVFNKAGRIPPLIGAIKQMNTLDGNGFKPHKKITPSVEIFFPNYRNNRRKNIILRYFRNRARHLSPGYYGYILNTEELATLYHFPVKEVRAPLLSRTETKKAEPPISLPAYEGEISSSSPLPPSAPASSPPQGVPPSNLPIENR